MSSSSASRGMSADPITPESRAVGGSLPTLRIRAQGGSAAEPPTHVARDLAQPVLERAQAVRLVTAVLLSGAHEDQGAPSGARHQPGGGETGPSPGIAERSLVELGQLAHGGVRELGEPALEALGERARRLDRHECVLQETFDLTHPCRPPPRRSGAPPAALSLGVSTPSWRLRTDPAHARSRGCPCRS